MLVILNNLRMEGHEYVLDGPDSLGTPGTSAGPFGPDRLDGFRTERTRLFVLARHAESISNVAGRVSSSPSHPMPLTERGRQQARQLGAQLANLDIGLAVGTRFLRTQQTLQLALLGRSVPVLVDPGFDELDAGQFDRAPIEQYWSWAELHSWTDRLPGGESRSEALDRCRTALRRVVARTEMVTLIVLHEFALRYINLAAANDAGFVSDAVFTEATPYLFDQRAIERAADRLESVARSAPPLKR
jgi:probable phosphoglycerate mutase